jgi:DNA-binding MarR family transcriptional regulator/CRP-like cAMP-binding protein
LATVAQNEGLSQTHLVKKTGIDRSTLADIVRRMLKKNLLQRRRTREDARAYAVKLTEEGWRTLHSVDPVALEVDNIVLGALANGDREQFIDHLNTIVAALSAMRLAKEPGKIPPFDCGLSPREPVPQLRLTQPRPVDKLENPHHNWTPGPESADQCVKYSKFGCTGGIATVDWRDGMVRDTLIHALRQIALFDGLSPMQITEIARRADRIVFTPGIAISTAHRPADGAIILISGKAERIAGPGLQTAPQLLPAGTIVTEMAMIIDTTPTSTVIAVTQVRALRIGREDIHELIAEDPSLGDHFMAKAAGRLTEIAAHMREIESELTHALEHPPASGRLSSATAATHSPMATPTQH